MKGRLDEIDGLRGIAALLVIVQHSFEIESAYAPAYWPVLHTVNLGRFGVLLFFLISGFVIPPSLERGGLARFAVNRAFRLLPALWLSIAVFVALAAFDGRLFSAADIAANMVMLARPLGMKEIAGIYWSLSYETGFYVFCAALFAAGLLGNRRVIALAAIATSMLAVITFRSPWSYPAYLLVGMLARRLFDGERETAPWLGAAVLWLICGTVVTSLAARGNPFLQPLPTLVGSLLPLPVFAAVVCLRPERVPSWLLWFGAVSYSVYLFQGVGLILLTPLLPYAPHTYLPLVALVTVGLAGLVYRYVEKPMIAVGRSLAQPMTRARA